MERRLAEIVVAVAVAPFVGQPLGGRAEGYSGAVRVEELELEARQNPR